MLRLRSAVVFSGILGAAQASSLHCRVLDATTVNLVDANCSGSSASSCTAIAEIAIPPDLDILDIQQHMQSVSSTSTAADGQKLRNRGLNVVHGSLRHGHEKAKETGGILRYSSSSFDSSETTDLYYSIDSRIVEAVDNVLEERYVEITIRFVGAEEVQEPISTQLATRNSVGDTYAIGLELLYCEPLEDVSATQTLQADTLVYDLARIQGGQHVRPFATARTLQEEKTFECDPYDGGDEACLNEISPAERGVLKRQGTNIYCSRECAVRGALWCNIFGKGKCRMCSNNCDAFCGEDNPDCRCHTCPESGATETWPCSVGNSQTCYDQVSEGAYTALAMVNQLMTCEPSCLERGGLWCNAMGIDGCRFCSLNCDAHCKATGQARDDCSCVQCPKGVTMPPSPPSEKGLTSCADADDGDEYCYGKMTHEQSDSLRDQGLAIECRPECYAGSPWPVWCYAQETVGCRYCAEDCSEKCGEGVPECETCYTCGSGTSGETSTT